MISAILVATLIGIASADDKAPTNKEAIVGSWEEIVDHKYFPSDYSLTMEFMKDGKAKVSIKFTNNDKPYSELEEGTYAIEGDEVITTGEHDSKRIYKIMKLIGKELILAEKDEDGTTDTWRLKKK
jgi:uncharacterized protein (TIGR03066 family)